MKERLDRTLSIVPFLVVSFLLAGCGSLKMPEMNVGKLWPFGEEKAEEQPRGPANATEYACEGNKRFYLRMIENGEAAWVILREREFRLDKAEAGRFARGANALEIRGSEATLTLDSAPAFSGCKAAGS